MIHTQLFWDTIKRGKYEIVISNLLLDEMNACPEPKRSFMRMKIAEVPFLARVEESVPSRALAVKYIDAGGLPPASMTDARHLAVATLARCDSVASWNLKHMANIRAVQAVQKVNEREGYAKLDILPPFYFIEDEEGIE